MFAEPGNRTIEPSLERPVCRHCGTVIERFLACEADRSWHHARTGESSGVPTGGRLCAPAPSSSPRPSARRR